MSVHPQERKEGSPHLDDHIFVLQEERDRPRLDGRHLFEAHVAYDIRTVRGMLSVPCRLLVKRR